MKLRHSAIAHVVCACALIGCAAPKTPVAEPTKTAPPQQPAKTEPEKPLVDDGLRVGNLMTLPKDTETRATNPTPAVRNPGGAAVVVTPPTPPAPKPAPKPE